MIEASLDGIKGERALTISDAMLTDLSLTPAAISLPKGLSQPFQLQGFYSDGTSLDVTRNGTWLSSNPAVASIDNAGLAQTLGVGSAHITASFGGRSVSVTLAVTDAVLTGMTVAPATVQLAKGLTQAMTVEGRFSDGSVADITASVSWQSRDPAIASIDAAGLAKALTLGTTEIGATFDKHTASATLEVTNATLTAIELTPASATVMRLGTQRYKARGLFTDGSNQDITAQVLWSSSDGAVASIDQKGVVKTPTVGFATIMAALGSYSTNVPLEVTVRAPLTSVSVMSSRTRSPIGDTQPFTVQGFFGDGSNADITDYVAWRTSDPTVASIDGAGAATALVAGKVDIIADLDGKSGVFALEVTPLIKQVVTWGSVDHGGNSSAVQPLGDVKLITNNRFAFAALKADGSAVAWGDPDRAGDSSAAQAQLTNIVQISNAYYGGFAALRADKTVVTWGNPSYGGDSSSVQPLTNVKQLFSNGSSFAALKSDGSVVTWGGATTGGDSSAVQAELVDIQTIFSAPDGAAFAALKSDGSVVTWGTAFAGGDSSAVQAQLTNVTRIFSSYSTFAALKGDGTVVTWGYASSGGDSSAVQAQLTGVKQVFSNYYSFAALKLDGSVVTWGDPSYGGDSGAVQAQLTGVKAILGNSYAFIALKADGTVVTWGDNFYGGDSSAVQVKLTNVKKIFRTAWAFAALKSDGTVVTWGEAGSGGNSTAVQPQLTNVVDIVSTDFAFAATKADGHVVTWGSVSSGSNSSAVQSQLIGVKWIVPSSNAFAAVTTQ
ncbi:Ig-like domain-containing protein [Aeromonas tecta]|uniref:Ig-like domain-containing protein n=1 Tax=Aeromonas tecta TaxID=324617 RepID=UPI0006805AF0|nr:Ig-like domain-containing protein [Aeromonas tecta]